MPPSALPWPLPGKGCWEFPAEWLLSLGSNIGTVMTPLIVQYRYYSRGSADGGR